MSGHHDLPEHGAYHRGQTLYSEEQHDEHDHDDDFMARNKESVPGVDTHELISEAMIQGIVARAWVDPAFRAALLADGTD